MGPAPNTATPTKAVGYPFHYMLPERQDDRAGAPPMATRRRRRLCSRWVRRPSSCTWAACRARQAVAQPLLCAQEPRRRRRVRLDARDGATPSAQRSAASFELPELPDRAVAAVWRPRHRRHHERPHHHLHYTFGHEYSLEGVPTIDSKHGAWAYDKRTYQQGLPATSARRRAARWSRPINWCRCCARRWPRTTTRAEPRRLHGRRAAVGQRHEPAAGAGGARPDRPGGRLAGLPKSDAALELGGTGPWRLSDGAPFFFLRGGQLHTPWGSAAWTARDDVGGGGGNGGGNGGNDGPDCHLSVWPREVDPFAPARGRQYGRGCRRRGW